MPANASFTYAIFKRLQAAYVSAYGSGIGGHLDADNAPSLMGGFSLRYPGDPHGIVGGTLSNAASGLGLAGLAPMAPTNVPADSPLYNMLSAGLGPDGTIPNTVPVGGKMWPVMPPPEQILPPPALGTQVAQLWLSFNNGNPPPLLTAFATWIGNGKPDDAPKDAPLAQPGLGNTPPPAFPEAQTALLFAASFLGDDGRRNGDGEVPAVPLSHVPANFWTTSPIFLCDANGFIANPVQLDKDAVFTVAAIVGNSSTGFAGSAVFASMPVHVLCDAQCFNTFLSPGVALPSLGNLDPADMSPTYEQFYLGPQSYDVVAFRFDVNAVFAGLAAALLAANVDLGGLSPSQWLTATNAHPCVKVRVLGGELPNFFPPQGNVPLTLASDPRKDRHIAQHNLAPFDMVLMAKKAIHWSNFIVAQAGAGPNALALQAGVPTGTVRFAVAVPTRTYQRYIAKGGSHRGFDVVHDVSSKPFPDAVILRQKNGGTSPEASIEIADHAREPFLGMALGVEAIVPARLGDVSMVHSAHDGHVVGGFTLRPPATR
ncbi:MAG: hypothetical protein ACHQK9_09430 [Reyranellales bacterium]